MNRARFSRTTRSTLTYDRFDGLPTGRTGLGRHPQGHAAQPEASYAEAQPVARHTEFAPPKTIRPALSAARSFAELALPSELLAALRHQGVTVPFPIQAVTLPNSLAGRDVLGLGRTRSGKTLAFGLPVLARTAGRRAEPQQPLALVLVPTGELALQVTEALSPYARAVRLRLAAVVGGASSGGQTYALRDGAEVVVATPGRLKDLVDRGDCRLSDVAVTVLDGADQMTAMGSMPQVTDLLDQVRPDGQRLLFSATVDRDVALLIHRYLSDPMVHSVGPSAGAVTTTGRIVAAVRPKPERPALPSPSSPPVDALR